MTTIITNSITYDLEYYYVDHRRLPRLTDEEQARFNDGVLKGHTLYRQCYQGKMLRPRALYDFLMTTLLDVTHPSVWNAGYIAGWFTAIHQDKSRLSLVALAQDMSVLLQQLQAHLHMAEEEDKIL